MLVAALGYGYLFAVVIGLLVTVYVVIWAMIAFGHAFLFKLVWLPLVLAWLVLKSMWITISPPDGKRIHRDQTPELFDVIAEVRAAIAGPHVHNVLLSDEFNAGIVQVPKFGMFGWSSNYLVVGVPLLKAIGPDEFRAVIAHEFGHLSGRHGRFAGWIYRIRQSWIQLLTNIQQERHYASFIFDWFINLVRPLLQRLFLRAGSGAGIRGGSLCGRNRWQNDHSEDACAIGSQRSRLAGRALVEVLSAGG